MWKVTAYQHALLVLLWLAYASSYLLRKPLALIKSDLVKDLALPINALGWLDVSLLLPYAGVSLTLGWVADVVGHRTVLGLGLVISGLCSVAIGWATNIYMICLLLFGTGASQALLWPAAGSILSRWFSPSDRNYAFGIFGTSCFAGSVLATYLAVYLRELSGWRGIFVPCSIIAICVGVLVLFFAHPPKTYNITIAGNDDADIGFEKVTLIDSKQGSTSTEVKKSLTFTGVMKLKLMPSICLSILCMKYVRYAFLLWLPYFLHEALNYSEVNAGMSSTVFDIGGVLGSLVNGFLVRHLFRLNNILGSAGTCFLTGIFMVLFFLSTDLSFFFHMTLLGLGGMFNCAGDILLTGPVAASIGNEHGAAAAVSGVINGMGSVGSVVQGPIVAWVGATLGWMAVIPLLTVVATLGGFASYRAYLQSLKLNISL